MVRHYTNLSNKNFGVDTGFYPLGSCTMKYNPKINEEVAAMADFAPSIRSRERRPYRVRLNFTTTCSTHLVDRRSGRVHAQSLRRSPWRAYRPDGDASVPQIARATASARK